MRLSDFVRKDMVSVNLKSRAKEGVINEIVDYLYRQHRIKDKKRVLESLLKREKLGSTGIGDGVAIPHARISDLKETVLFVGISKGGISFDSLDSKPVHLITFFLTPLLESELHLKILSKIAAMLNNKLFVMQLVDAPTNERLYYNLKQGGMEKEEFPALNKEEVYLELASSDNGISELSAQKRLEVYGPNKLKAIRRTPLILRFLSNFTNLLAVLIHTYCHPQSLPVLFPEYRTRRYY